MNERLPTEGVPEPELRTFSASDGYRLSYRHWPRPTPRGYVVGLHGIQSHSGWYEYSSGRLWSAGYDVRFLDRRGSGLNQRDRGHAVHADRLMNDVVHCLGAVRHERDARQRSGPAAPVPIVLASVSWGGRLAAAVAAERPELIDALALLYPGILARIQATRLQRVLLRGALWCGLTRRMVEIPLRDPGLFAREPRWQQFIASDPLALHQVSTSFLAAGQMLAERAVRNASRITCPTLLMLAGCDRIVDNTRTRQWYARLGSRHQTLIEYPHAAHTLEFEPDRDRFVADLLDWLERTTARQPEPLPVRRM